MTEPSVVPMHVHRTLVYLERLAMTGVQPTRRQVESYAVAEPPRGSLSGYNVLMGLGLDAMSETARSAQPVVEYLMEVGWVTASGSAQDSLVELTALGSAFLVGSRASAPTDVEATGAAATVVLDPSEPFVYLDVTRAVAEAGAGMVVDPFFKPTMLRWLVDSTTIERLLIKPSKSERTGIVAQFGLALAGLVRVPGVGRLEVRASTDASLHDRCVLHANGQVSVLGTSLNGIGRHMSTIMPMPTAGTAAYTEHLEQMWTAAEVVEPREIQDSAQAPST